MKYALVLFLSMSFLSGLSAQGSECSKPVELAAKKSWVRRHPIITSLGVGAVGIGLAVAPIWPGDYVGTSPALSVYISQFDSGAYRGASNMEQWKQVETLSKSSASLQQAGWTLNPVTPIPDLHSRSPEEVARQMAILKFYQPWIFQDRVPLDKAARKDMDVPVNPLDQSENPLPTIFGQLKETPTHWFAIYPIVYRTNNFDAAKTSGLQELVPLFPKPTKFNHDWDIEVVVEVIRKTEGVGQREATLTFRHGMMHAHSTDSARQDYMRARLASAFSGNILKGDKQNVAFGYLYQPNAIAHDSGIKATAISEDKLPMGTFIFSSRMGHATYPLNPEAWVNGHGTGIVYVPEALGVKAAEQNPVATLGQNIQPIRLMDWDAFVAANRNNPALFTGTQDPFELTTSQGKIRARTGNPQSFTPSKSGEEAKTNVPAGSRGRTPYPLAVPDAVYRFLVAGYKDEGLVSDDYLYNADIEIVP